MTKKDAEELLKAFQCDYNRSIEENFAQTLSENEAVRLFFINEDQAFTDGRNIVVDPAEGQLYTDARALRDTEEWMKLPHELSADPWCALKMITRAQTIHEALHIIYSDFPNPVVRDPRSATKARKKALALIANIIEDAFIEAAGCSVYDHLELYLTFGRVSRLFANTPCQGTVDRAFREKDADAAEPSAITRYLNYMATFLLYPMVKQEAPDNAVAPYVEQTKPIFIKGSLCGVPSGRHRCSQAVFDLIEPLIPESDGEIDDDGLKRRLGGLKTHSGDATSIGRCFHRGKICGVARRLFVDADGAALPGRDFSAQFGRAVAQYRNEHAVADKIVFYQGARAETSGEDYDCARIHKGIKIIENKPKINLNLRKAYQNLYEKYHININSYNSRFAQLLKAKIPFREEKKRFGSGISSRMLCDTKKRYWYRNSEEEGVPDLAVLLLIDGSGSMYGERRDSAMTASVILHEVLKKQGIEHCIAEHRAGFEEPAIDVNILVDFHAGEEQKYNLMQIKAEGDNRDGLALYWAERYLGLHSASREKLIVVLSDGAPVHAADDYYPPVSVKDTANAVAKIQKRGTRIVAVALDNGDPDCSCYEMLREIYPSLIDCTDLKRLTGQLLTLVSREIER